MQMTWSMEQTLHSKTYLFRFQSTDLKQDRNPQRDPKRFANVGHAGPCRTVSGPCRHRAGPCRASLGRVAMSARHWNIPASRDHACAQRQTYQWGCGGVPPLHSASSLMLPHCHQPLPSPTREIVSDKRRTCILRNTCVLSSTQLWKQCCCQLCCSTQIVLHTTPFASPSKQAQLV